MARKWITREQVLDFNSLWSEEDRKVVAALLDGVADAVPLRDEVMDDEAGLRAMISEIPERLDHYYVVASKAYVCGRAHDGHPLFWIRPGAIEIHFAGRDVWAVNLSRHAVRGPKEKPPRQSLTCPTCGEWVPLSGICDNCG